jgi:hypothetical protein
MWPRMAVGTAGRARNGRPPIWWACATVSDPMFELAEVPIQRVSPRPSWGGTREIRGCGSPPFGSLRHGRRRDLHLATTSTWPLWGSPAPTHMGAVGAAVHVAAYTVDLLYEQAKAGYHPFGNSNQQPSDAAPSALRDCHPLTTSAGKWYLTWANAGFLCCRVGAG